MINWRLSIWKQQQRTKTETNKQLNQQTNNPKKVLKKSTNYTKNNQKKQTNEKIVQVEHLSYTADS